MASQELVAVAASGGSANGAVSWPRGRNDAQSEELPRLPADSASLLRDLKLSNNLKVYACTWNMQSKVCSTAWL
jgi:hypothetical protein